MHITAVTLLALSSCGNRGTEEAAGEHAQAITFAVFGNTGYTADGGEALKTLAEAVNSSGSDFAVDLGNRLPVGVSPSGIDALWDAADEDRELFNMPVYPVVGSNDIFDFESDVVFSRRYGPLWYEFRHGGVRFFALNTEDEVYRSGFGVRAEISMEQLDWLENRLDNSGGDTKVVFMHRPLWEEAPALWRTYVLPVLKAGDVDLVVTCSDRGLFDWGRVDGIRAVSSGCTGPVKDKGIGLFPHVLLVKINSGGITFTVFSSDGKSSEGIEINSDTVRKVESFAASIGLPVLKTDHAWKISESFRLSLDNNFIEPVSGELRFRKFGDTSWKIEPPVLDFELESGTKKTFRLAMAAVPPELGPQPVYSAKFRVGDRAAYEFQGTVKVRIPPPRTGEPVSINARVADILPYNFGKKPLKVPVNIEGVDICGRLIVYREGYAEAPECVHVSPLKDFRPGMNEFLWNGRDLKGNKVFPDSLTYRVFVYNKKAPATWVAVGPPSVYGTVTLERSLTGLAVKTHDDRSLCQYRIGASVGAPKSEMFKSFTDVLEDQPLTGFALGSENRIYLGTEAGIACVILKKDGIVPDLSFGRGGYAGFSEYRGRLPGSPAYSNGLVYAGIGGGEKMTPCIVILDGKTGRKLAVTDLGEYYGEEENPPSLAVTERGLYCAHPDRGRVIHTTHYGDVLWVSDPASWVIGTDSDGRSFNYGISVDSDGFVYVNTPGYSARCVVIGPDGRGLFRVILVNLPGLRVSSVVPVVEGKKTDGLYFVTRGGDIPYIFHVPFTVRKGIIVDEAEFIQ